MTHSCGFCGAALSELVIDLGMSPLSNAYVAVDADEPEELYPLAAYVCGRCMLVQVPPVTTREKLFGEYVYFSSYSDSWLAHARKFAAAAQRRLQLGPDSLVVEIACNDGYLLQYFVRAGIPVLGIEPAAEVASAAREKGVETVTEFFGVSLADQLAASGRRASLLVANNVLAHVPDLSDFAGGLRIVLAPGGTLTLEFPHLMKLMLGRQFDTIYHEHFSYFSLMTAMNVLAAHALKVVDVEELPTHGGSLRLYARHAGEDVEISPSVGTLLQKERDFGLDRIETYRAFGESVKASKRALVDFLVTAKRDGKSVAAYGAPAKASTLLNYCGVTSDLVAYTVDRNPHKQGHFLPGTGIPIYPPEKLAETRPDFVLILPWNLRDEITEQMACVRSWGGRLVVPVPEVEVLA